MPIWIPLICSLLLACSLRSHGELPAQTIRVLTETWPGYTNLDGSGYYFNLLSKVYHPKGFEFDTRHMNHARAMAALRKGEADVLLGTYEGSFPVSWQSKYPVEIDNLAVALSKPLFDTWRGVDTLTGKRVAAVYGNFYDKYYKLDVDYVEVRSVEAMLKMLQSKRIDAVINYKLSLMPAFDRLGIEERYVIPSVFQKKLYFIFYNSEKAQYLKHLFDESMEQLIRSGELKQMIVEELGGVEFYPDYQLPEKTIK